MTLQSVGDTVRNGTYRIHSRFDCAWNFTDGRRFVSVVTEEVGAGPANIVLAGAGGPLADRLGRAAVLNVAGRALRLGRHTFRAARGQVYRSSLEVPAGRPARLARNLEALERRLAGRAPPRSLAFLLDARRLSDFAPGFEQALAARLRAAVETIFGKGELSAGVRRLAGCGFGLTPSGDDFIAGLLVALNVRARLDRRDERPTIRRVRRAARGAPGLSRAFLDLAARGRVCPRTMDLVRALLRGTCRGVEAAADRLLAVGATSGADFGTGFLLTMKSGTG